MVTQRPSTPGARLDLTPRGTHGQLSFEDLGTPLEEVTFVVVDLETTGGAPSAESITEIGAVKVRGGETLGELASLVNPGIPIPAFITTLTGITTAMVLPAPRIREVLPSFLEFLGKSRDTVLVAHNARFDVGHLRAACAALDIAWPKVRILDTVALARRTFTRDEAPNVKLSTLARICGVATPPSHRALDDARATVEVLHAMLARLGPLGVTHLEDLATATDPVSERRRRKAVLADGLPKTPGVYHFIGPGDQVLYVGTSVNVFKRVRQYFTAAEKRSRMAEMVDLAERVEAHSTQTVLEARVRELRDIARLDPPYNRRSRRPDKLPWLAMSDEAHPRLIATTNVPLERATEALGPFSSRSQARRAQVAIAEVSGLRTCTRKLPANPRKGAEACHLKEMGKCDAPCVVPGLPDALAVAMTRELLVGSTTRLWDAQMRQLAALASAERFEQASESRDRLAAALAAHRKRERILPLLLAPEIRAARHRDDGAWEVALIRWGRLEGTRLALDSLSVEPTADNLAASVEARERPEVAGEATHIEETQILAEWLWQKDTRLVSLDSSMPLALPRDSAAKRSVPQREDQESADSSLDRRIQRSRRLTA